VHRAGHPVAERALEVLRVKHDGLTEPAVGRCWGHGRAWRNLQHDPMVAGVAQRDNSLPTTDR